MEQGRLEPLHTHVKKNKRGLGAEKIKEKKKLPEYPTSQVQNELVNSYMPVTEILFTLFFSYVSKVSTYEDVIPFAFWIFIPLECKIKEV